MHWFYALIYLGLLQPSTSISPHFLPQYHLKPSKSSESLARLLRTIARDYFSDCALAIIYDSNYELSHPVDFNLYFSGAPFSFTQETIDLSSGGKPRDRQTDKCTNYVIFLENILTVKHVMAQNTKSKIVLVSSQTPWEVKDFLKSHYSKLYMHLLIVAHSTSRRTADGSYLLYTHKLYAEGSGSTQPMLLASWIDDKVSVTGLNFYPEKLRQGFLGHRLLVSTFDNPPFTIKRGIGSEGSKWDGIEVRILKLAAEYLNFTVEFTEPRYYSEVSPVESIKNDVSLGITAAAAAGIYRTAEVGDAFDATTSYVEDCAAFITLASTALPKYRAILGPFQLSVWILLCIAYFILIIPLSFSSKYTILSLIKHPSGLNNMFWFVFSTYTNSFVVKNPLLNYGIAKNSIAMLLGIYWVFTIIVTSCYTGSIVAFITLPVYPSAMESAKELLAYRYRIGTLDHNGWEKWFNVNTTDDPFLKSLFRKMEYVPTVLEGVQNASRAYFWPYAFLASRTTLEYLIQRDFAPTWTTKRTLMHVSDECFVHYNVVQLFSAKSLYTKSMNGFISRATETGLINKITSDIDWEVQLIAMSKNKQITKRVSKEILVEDRTLTVEDTQGMFLILGSGVLMALLTLSFESMTNFIKRRKMGNNEDAVADASWERQSRVDSWVIRENAFPGIRMRPSRGSV